MDSPVNQVLAFDSYGVFMGSATLDLTVGGRWKVNIPNWMADYYYCDTEQQVYNFFNSYGARVIKSYNLEEDRR